MRWTAIVTAALACGLAALSYGLSFLITEPPPPFANTSTPARYKLAWQEFSVRSADGVRLSGWWIPGSDGAARPVVLFVHGLGAAKSDCLANAAFASARGYSCALIDLRNHGGSDRRVVTLGGKESEDVRAVLEWLRREKHASSFVLWGYSLGAASSALAAVSEPDVDGLILEAPFESMRATVDRHARILYGLPHFPLVPLTLAWFEWRTGIAPDQIDVTGAVSRIKRGRIFVATGSADDLAPPAAARLIASASSVPCELWIAEGADHNHLGSHPDHQRRIERFLMSVEQDQRKRLQPAQRPWRPRTKSEKPKNYASFRQLDLAA